MPAPDDTFWKSKLAAFLHDPPEKVLDLAWHKNRAKAHQSGFDLEDAAFNTRADHTAAAADRLPWPTYSHLACAFDGKLNHFKHPLGQARLSIKPFPTADLATEGAWKSRPHLDHVSPGRDLDRAQFLAHWRLWRWWASDLHQPKDSRIAFLPADTRIPDHTIWAHNSLVSAFQGCVDDGRCCPAFLMFNIGPVQDFIAQARRTLDLWSGSYLLSYLTAAALRHLALSLGPDQVIFPNLCGQPIMDLLLKDEIWDHAFIIAGAAADPLWTSFGYDTDYASRRLLTPSLPNRFLALVPASRAEQIAVEIRGVIEKTFANIADAVWSLVISKLAPLHPVALQHERFLHQTGHHLEISWQTLAWPKLPDEALAMTACLPKSDESDPQAGLRAILALAAKMPKEQRDVRNFECARFQDGSKRGWKDKDQIKDDARLDNPGAAWSALFSQLNWQLDAVRQTRAWKAWSNGGWDPALVNEKDSLTGKEEGILNLASGEITKDHVKQLGRAIGSEHLFKKGEVLGATTLIKRLWPTAWLMKEHGFKAHHFRLPDTRNIADGKPFDEGGDDDDAPEGSNGYFAVLAFDGDEMGKWISGTHPAMPKLGDLLANYTENGEQQGAVAYFASQPALKHLLDLPRPLNPSFHLQFSEMLGTFSNVCARRIVEAFDGCLIYSGGDDVLALLPSGQALACARALRSAFRGTTDLNEVKGAWEVDIERNHRVKNAELQLFDVTQEGFVQLHSRNHLTMAGEPKSFPAIVPGPATNCSVGIAIAHFKSPLQDVVRAAQRAEKHAKNTLGRAAFAVTLMKRSGEITEWGAKWHSGGLELYMAIAQALETKSVSAKFPHRVCQLLEPYRHRMDENSALQDATDFDATAVIRQEFSFALSRQSAPGKHTENQDALLPKLDIYLAALDSTPQTLLQALDGLCTAVAFAHRTRNETPSADRQPA
ncbi:MAG: type III-B CRISPR-associated protein Cas10/Cmr2 [Verrucomicrobia bacterium]|nr:type III-B CRISPR-associated protein Cas10/Cmr2 [Verrucomicrobiota bacterium]